MYWRSHPIKGENQTIELIMINDLTDQSLMKTPAWWR